MGPEEFVAYNEEALPKEKKKEKKKSIKRGERNYHGFGFNETSTGK